MGHYLVLTHPKDYANRVYEGGVESSDEVKSGGNPKIRAVQDRVNNYGGHWYEDPLGFEDTRTQRKINKQEAAIKEIKSNERFEETIAQAEQFPIRIARVHEADEKIHEAHLAAIEIDIRNGKNGLTTRTAEQIAINTAHINAEAEREYLGELGRRQTQKEILTAEQAKEEALLKAGYEDHQNREELALKNKPIYDQLEANREITTFMNEVKAGLVAQSLPEQQLILILTERIVEIEKEIDRHQKDLSLSEATKKRIVKTS